MIIGGGADSGRADKEKEVGRKNFTVRVLCCNTRMFYNMCTYN